MARKPKNATIDIRQAERVFDEHAFGDRVFNVTISSLCKWYKK